MGDITIPGWVIAVLVATWPWVLVVASAMSFRPSGYLFDIDFLTPFLAFGAFMWTLACVMQWFIS